MRSLQTDDRAEPKAKANLLNFLRAHGRLSRLSVVTAELILDKQAVRADMVLCDHADLHCFEIKTGKDTLTRLDRQLEIYASHADFVTVVAATKHVNTVMSRVPAFVGIYEMVTFSTAIEIKVVREAQRSPLADVNSMLSLLPVTELRARLALSGGSKRKEAITQATALPDAQKKDAVISFFRDRYGPNFLALLRATKRRKIQPKDLTLLRRWHRGKLTGEAYDAAVITSSARNGCQDQAIYNHVGRSFGPVPEEVRAMLAG